MSISKLKDDARRHELREEWEKAVQVYLQVLIQAEHGEGEVELPLYNRIGDLYIRLNRPQEAVRYYEQAADRYADVGLYNNAIALCNKALRYEPQQLTLLRKLGLFSALQGFYTDARRYFLDYADKQAAQGHGDDALRALEEYNKIADNADSHELYGRRLHEHGRTREGLAQLRAAYELRVAAGEVDRADALRAELQTIDPAVRFGDETPAAAAPASTVATDGPTSFAAEPEEQLGVQTEVAHALEIEHTSFESTASGSGRIDTSMLDVDDATPAETVSYGALEGLESTTMDFGTADTVEEQDLGAGFEREETSFIAPEPAPDGPAELPLLDDSADLPLLPEADFGLPANAEDAPPPAYDLTGATPDAPLLDLSALEHGGLLLPELDADTSNAVAMPALDVDADLDLPLITHAVDDDAAQPEDAAALDFAADAATSDLIDLDALTDVADAALEQPFDESIEDVREPVLEESDLDFGEIADDLDDVETGEEDDALAHLGAEFEPPPTAGLYGSLEPPAASSFGRSLAGWPEDRDDDVAAALRSDDEQSMDDALYAVEENDTSLLDAEDVSGWEARALTAEELTAAAAPLTFEVDTTELVEQSEIEPAEADEYGDPAAAAEVAFDQVVSVEPTQAERVDDAPGELESALEALPDNPAAVTPAGTDWAAAEEQEREPEQDGDLPVGPWYDRDIETETETHPVEPAPLDDEPVVVAAAAEELVPPALSSGMSPRTDEPNAGANQLPRDEGYIDLGALLVDDEVETTRFRIQETAPSGDEDQDFAELLGRFKEKVAQHLPPEDAAAHYDLGLAFKEMGLIDEAIAEFQVALRTGPMRLKVYEEIGQCFLLKEQYNIAEKVLRQALQVDHQHELDLLGIYYQLGRAYEAMNKREQARDAYERVLGMDLNFQDTAARLARL